MRYTLSLARRPVPYVTYVLLLACVVLTSWDLLWSTRVSINSPLRTYLLFDYPHAIALSDGLLNEDPHHLSREKLKELNASSLWGGAYLTLFARITDLHITPRPTMDPGLACEQIREGQIWRLFCPFSSTDLFSTSFSI